MVGADAISVRTCRYYGARKGVFGLHSGAHVWDIRSSMYSL